MATIATSEESKSVSPTERAAEVVVPAAEKLDRKQVQELVGAKNVMGTCSG